MEINKLELEDFVGALSTFGIARSSQYQVQLGLPNHFTKGSDSGVALTKLLSLYAQSASIPPRNINTTPYRIEHAHFEIPYGISYEPVSITFMVDVKLIMRNFFTNWHALIYKSDNGMEFYNDYVSTRLEIISLDKGLAVGEKVYTTTLINAYPKSVGEIQYSSSSQGEVATITVQFVYERMIEELHVGKLVEPAEEEEEDIPEGDVNIGPIEQGYGANTGHATTLNEPQGRQSPAYDGFEQEVPAPVVNKVNNGSNDNISLYYNQDAAAPLVTAFGGAEATNVRGKIGKPKSDIYKKNT